MIRPLFAALLLIGAALSGTADAAAQASDGTIVRRTTLLVHDLARSITFYRILGFEKWYEGPPGKVTGRGLPVDGVAVGEPTQLVIMRGKDPYVGMIGLLRYGPKTVAPPAGRMRVGDAVLMIETKGIADIARRLAAGGYRIHKPLEVTHIKSVDAEWDASFLMVFDPDGRMVELTERLN